MTEHTEHVSTDCSVTSGPVAGEVRIVVRGTWTRAAPVPHAALIADNLVAKNARSVSFDATALAAWDSSLPAFASDLATRCAARGITLDPAGLPEGVRSLVDLARAGGRITPANDSAHNDRFLSLLGEEAARAGGAVMDAVTFTGDVAWAFCRLFRGKARVRWCDVIQLVRSCGAEALPIVSLVGVLVGVVFAFIGVIQLKQFGVQMYVADLVGVIMIRVMGAIMAGVVLAGRTGSAFAAQIGTMEVNDELDALRSLGISPTEFLVVPRILALTVMMPLLCLYTSFLGVCGGMVVGVNALHLNMTEYFMRTRGAVSLCDVGIGLFESVVFGVLVAGAGCLCGMRCGRSASAVGNAATRAVVYGIVGIIVATAIITVICSVLGI